MMKKVNHISFRLMAWSDEDSMMVPFEDEDGEEMMLEVPRAYESIIEISVCDENADKPMATGILNASILMPLFGELERIDRLRGKLEEDEQK